MLPALITLWILLFLLLLASLPIRVRIWTELSFRGGRIHAQIRLFGFLKIPLTFTLHLFSDPHFTLFWRGRTFPLLCAKPKTKKPSIVPDITIDQLHLTYILGIADDAATTVWALGSLQVLSQTTAQVLSLPLSLSLRPVFNHEIFRIILESRVTIRLTESIIKYWRQAHAPR
ncbi:MAG: hypothetical protein FWE69_06850 [Clostridiales bacterium]|nr:hypothetical protein [Clostridiales bacterium]